MKYVFEEIAKRYSDWRQNLAEIIADNLYFGERPLCGWKAPGEPIDDDEREVYSFVWNLMANSDF